MTTALAGYETQLAALVARARSAPPRVSQVVMLAAYAPPSPEYADISQALALVARSGGTHNVAAEVTQAALLVVYGTGVPGAARQDTWTFVLDGHRFWVLPLGDEGTWAYDTVTKQWCHLHTQGFGGQLNFAHGIMYGLRIVGTDLLYNKLYELDPTQMLDEGWRPIKHVVTGGVQVRSSQSVGCANFRLTASSGFLQSDNVDMNLSFSDDNGNTWSPNFTQTLVAGNYSQQLIYSGLGSFSAPGRIFKIEDEGGLVRIDGADAGLNNFDDDVSEK